MHFFLNGERQDSQELSGGFNLLCYLRTNARLTSVKNGCGEGACGTCTVLVEGKAQRACKLKLRQVANKRVVTVDGLNPREKEIYSLAFASSGAVQCGFCTPGMIMSAKALLDINPTPTDGEIKQALRGNLCRCTGYVKIVEAVARAAALLRGEEMLEPQPQVCGIGSRYLRPDAAAKTLGEAVFTDDVILPGMLHAAVLRPQWPRIKLHSISTASVKALPDVVAVLTAEDIPGEKSHGYIKKDWPVLVGLGEETRYLGDALAIVVAETPTSAALALSQLEVVYDVLPALSSPQAALAAGAPELHVGGNILSATRLQRGDVELTLSQCSHVVTAQYTTPMTEHAFLEPESALAYWDEGFLVVQAGSQSVHHDQHEIAAILSLPVASVVVRNNFVGGAFGGKEDLSVQHHAALAAWHTKRPVKLTLTRAESLLVHPKRHPMAITMSLGCDEKGHLLALRAEIVADTGAYASLGAPVLERACTHATGPYRIPSLAIQGRAVYTNNPPAGAFRGFGVPQAAFAIEGQLDRLAELVGISPWEIRYRNALVAGDLLATGQVVADVHLRDTLLAVKDEYEQSSYAGIACGMKNVGLGVGLADVGRATLRVASGRVQVLTGAACIGQGLASVLLQIVCAITALKPEGIEVVLADTERTLDSGATTASRQTLFTGEAVRQAAEKLAADLTQAELHHLEGREYRGEYRGITDSLRSTKEAPVTHVSYSFGTQVVLLDEVGKVKKVIAAYDVGRAINPTLLEGQIEGGILMGLGYALTEDFPLEECIPKCKTLGKLGLWRTTDVPEISIILIEKNLDEKAFGAKGIGEISCIPTAPGVAAAYFALDGERRTSLPLQKTVYTRG